MKTQTRVGLYLTLIVHLLALIAVLGHGVGKVVRPESSFVIDFSRQEELQREAVKEARHAVLTQEVEEMLKAVRQNTRNVVVDRGARLKDDRYRNPSKVYEEARDLQRKLNAAKKAAMAETGDEPVASGKEAKSRKASDVPYTGPSVLEYRLDGRKALSLPIPAYKCLGGGDVTVIIWVDRRGYVKDASIREEFSSQDACLRRFALKAAGLSRFTVSDNAPPRQQGEIVYRFMAQ